MSIKSNYYYLPNHLSLILYYGGNGGCCRFLEAAENRYTIVNRVDTAVRRSTSICFLLSTIKITLKCVFIINGEGQELT